MKIFSRGQLGRFEKAPHSVLKIYRAVKDAYEGLFIFPPPGGNFFGRRPRREKPPQRFLKKGAFRRLYCSVNIQTFFLYLKNILHILILDKAGKLKKNKRIAG